MKTKYKVCDTVYVVKDYNIIKSVIDSIDIKMSEKKTEVLYNVYGLRQQNDPKKRIVPFIEAYLVDDLETAKKSALANLNSTLTSARAFIVTLKDEMFEPIKMEEIK